MSFGAIALLIVYMASASVLEKFYGTDAVMKWGYRSAGFAALWAIAALSGIIYLYFKIIRGRNRMKIPFATAGIHLAFVMILAGALVTHIYGKQGVVHLRKGDSPVREYVLEDGTRAPFPFSVSLEDFHIEYYPGSYAPCDYVSTLKVAGDREDVAASVSMNRIFKYSGYRFYQSAYDDDGRGATLAVSHDPAGVTVTYSGYALLLLSLICFFFQKNSGFKSALRTISGKSLAVAVLLAASVSQAGAFSPDRKAPEAVGQDGLKYLPREVAEEYGRTYVYYNDRICPMQTLARDFTLKLYGKTTYKGLSAEQVLTGWIFYGDSWRKTVEPRGSDSRKARMKEQDRENTIMLVCSARLLKIFPYRTADGKVDWYSSVDTLPSDMDSGQWIFVRRVMSLAGESVMKKDFAGAGEIFGKIRQFQTKTAAEVLPADSRIAAERIYNILEKPAAAAMFCLAAGLVLFLSACFRNTEDRRTCHSGRTIAQTVSAVSFIMSVIVFVYLSVIFILRWYISAHVPMSNGFETMMLLAWHTMMLTVFTRKKYPLIQPFGFLLSGFALLVASMSESDPRITHMMPVLSSPLLSVHVMCMMISYTLLGLVMLNSLFALVRHYLGAHRDSRTGLSVSFSLVILYPAVFFLAAGTFLGAVWANVSWGRYWGWDPKEVWALVTMLVYSFAFHTRSLAWLSRPSIFHTYMVVAFLSVLITYFGVNFLLGGLHSYA